ncbi:putative transmembrane protein, partial [Gregarina niphandrodes]
HWIREVLHQRVIRIPADLRARACLPAPLAVVLAVVLLLRVLLLLGVPVLEAECMHDRFIAVIRWMVQDKVARLLPLFRP